MNDKFNRRCCFNCSHHLDYHMDDETLVCLIEAQRVYTLPNGEDYVGVDYKQRKPSATPPCKDWNLNTNIPQGFQWGFIKRQPQQLKLFDL